MIIPDFSGNNIVNLMSSISLALGGESTGYPPLNALHPSRIANAETVILMIIDGMGYEYLRKKGPGSVLHSNLTARIMSTFPPTTATAIPTFFTGLAPLQHSFTGWFTWFRELGATLAVLPFKPRCGGELARHSNINPLVLSRQQPFSDRLQVTSYVVSPVWIAHSVFNLAFSGTATIRPYDTLEEYCGQLRKIVATRESRQYVHAYWPRFDTLSHLYGVGSSEVADHFTELNIILQKLVNDLAGSNTVLIITADHGFIDTTPECMLQLSEHPQLEETLTIPLSGEPRCAYCYVHPDKQKQFESYVNSELAAFTTLYRSRELLETHFFGLGNAHPHIAQRVGDYTLVMKENFTIKDWITGEEKFHNIGVHGGSSTAELYVPLIIIDC